MGVKRREFKGKEAYLPVNGGNIWYKVSGEGNKRPLLMLHGGPGYPSYYLNELNDLSKERPVIIFDQLGVGKSDAITDTTLMTVDNYVDQVHKLVSALELNEFYLYGHSWGTMLAMDYYLSSPSRVKGLILASPCMSAKIYERDAKSLITTLPDPYRTTLQNDIKGISQDPDRLSQAVDVYWNEFYLRKPPTANGELTIAEIAFNIYTYMWGENDYNSTGILKDYDRTAELASIKVPVLFTGGEYDVATPSTLEYYKGLTPASKTAVVKGAGHVTMNDDPAKDVEIISNFLKGLDNN